MILGYSILIGLVFGLWGLLGSKVNGGVWTAPIVMSLTAITAFLLGRRQPPEHSASLRVSASGGYQKPV